MAFVIADHVSELSTTTGTSAFSLSGISDLASVRFSSKCSVGDTCFYGAMAVDGAGSPTGEWEIGIGTYSATNTLTRTQIMSSSNGDSAVSFSVGTKQVFITMPAEQVAWARDRLTADRTYYVATTGNDSSDGRTPGTPFLTVQKAIDTILTIDISKYQVTIQVADGTYTTPFSVSSAWIGGGNVTVQGNESNPSNVLFNITGNDVVVSELGARLVVKNLKLVASGNFLLRASTGGHIDFSGLNFGSCRAQQIRADDGGSIKAIGSYTISGSSGIHISSVSQAIIRIQSVTVTLVGTPAFGTAYVSQTINSSALVNACTFSGSATGKRYDITGNSVCNAGGVTTYLPGNAAGTTATGGQYI